MDDPKRENPDQFHHYTSIVDDFNKLEIKAYNNSFTKLAMMLSKVAFPSLSNCGCNNQFALNLIKGGGP